MHSFEQLLSTLVPKIARKMRQFYKALWILETTGSSDAVDLKAELDAELRQLLGDAATYEKLLLWDQDASLKDPLLKRQLNVLLRSFKQNLIPKTLLEELSQKEAALSQTYANFRPKVAEKDLSDNEIREILKKETNPIHRKAAWEASKEIGTLLAPQILSLVALRNKAAQSLGYPDYFRLQLDLQEVDEKWLFSTFDALSKSSDSAYEKILQSIEEEQSKRFAISKDKLGPWAWSDPFCQEDPLDNQDLDSLVEGIDISLTSKKFYERMGIDVAPILQRSDMFERPGKNQHAFCINIDRGQDVRTLNNVASSIKWLETVLHELGHAVYELGFEPSLPWLLREPPHMITTEAMALIAGRQAYRYDALRSLIKYSEEKEPFLKKAEHSLRRRQLIFSRWVLVMTHFESELYKEPKQDLNSLWWELVKKYQKINPPSGREGKSDWAAKYHIGLAPVYYFSYLLGEMFASSIEETLIKETGSRNLDSIEAGRLLQERLFYPGNRMSWKELVSHVTGEELSFQPWIRQFAGHWV